MKSALKVKSYWSRKKKPTGLKAKAWKTFATWIKERDKQCVTCGQRDKLDAGHFFHNCLDFDEMNVNAQCQKCNRFMGGNLAQYSIYLLRKYGKEKMEDLEKRHWLALRGEFRSDEDYRKLIEKYQLSPVKRVIDY